jgi:ornithine cyclodeaminase/alanine dehydrogenase-like protein (mu-crystallin family)
VKLSVFLSIRALKKALGHPESVAMPLTVLSDSDVRALLVSLKKEDIAGLQESLAEALHEYSTGDTNSSCCSSYQPQRTVIKRKGVTTLFMPASTGESLGMKIVALETPEAPDLKKESSASLASAMSGVSMSPSNNTTKSSASSISGASFQPPASVASSSTTTPRGTLTMLDRSGLPTGLVNAEELTAFRTALAATIIFSKRHNVHMITVFGAGKQAYWHIRLALILRGSDIKHINIINRSFERSIELMKQFQVNEGQDEAWRSHAKFSALSPDFQDYGRLLKEDVRKADVLFCCTPSLDPLFPAEFLTSSEGRKKGRFVSGIGSYAPHMTELHPDIFRQAVAPEHHRHHHKHAAKSGVVIVDSLESCLKEAGEIIQAKLKPEQLVEIGELMMIKKAAMKEIELGGKGEKGLRDWLMKGNVLYKSVGLGLMDLRVGWDLVILARERGIGTTIPDF